MPVWLLACSTVCELLLSHHINSQSFCDMISERIQALRYFIFLLGNISSTANQEQLQVLSMSQLRVDQMIVVWCILWLLWWCDHDKMTCCWTNHHSKFLAFSSWNIMRTNIRYSEKMRIYYSKSLMRDFIQYTY